MHRLRQITLAAALMTTVPLLAPRALAQEPTTEEQIGEKILMRVPAGGGPEIPVEEILRDVGERLKKVITIDEALRGKKIRFYTSAEITFNVLRAVLQSYEVELVFETIDNRQILHAYLQRNTQTRIGWGPTPYYGVDEKLPNAEQVVTAVYVVRYADPAQIANQIRALMTRDPRRVGNPISIPKSPALIITDFSSSVEFYLKIVKVLDQPSPQFTHKTVQVQFADANELSGLINTLLKTLEPGAPGAGGPAAPPPPGQPGGGGGRGQAVAGQPQVVADVRTNKMVILAMPEELSWIEDLIHEMDVKVQPPPRKFHVYKCINANAADLADQLNQLFGGAGGQFGRTPRTGPTGTGGRMTTGGLGGSSSRYGGGSSSLNRYGGTTSGRTTSGALGQQTTGATTAGLAPGGAGGARPAASALNPGEMGLVETRIIPDPQTNSLLVQANVDDWNEIAELLKQLDKKRLRVIIEAQVWEIDVTDDLFFAIDADYATNARTNSNATPLRGDGLFSNGLLAPQVSADQSTLGLTPNFGQVTGFPSTLQNGGMIVALTKGGFDKIPLIIQALESKSNANLLTTPFAITNDNEQAEFQVEEQAPYLETTSQVGAGAFQGFNFAQAISRLAITPRISSGNNLTLNIELEIQSFTDIPTAGQPPSSNARRYFGTVTIPNRQFIVFGGLEQDSITERRHTLPFLGDIPYIGYFFGRTEHVKERKRVYVFVRPVIFADEGFEDERKASEYAHENIRSQSLLGPEHGKAIIPDEVMDAEAPGARAILYRVFGDGGALGMPEDAKTRAVRRTLTESK